MVKAADGMGNNHEKARVAIVTLMTHLTSTEHRPNSFIEEKKRIIALGIAPQNTVLKDTARH